MSSNNYKIWAQNVLPIVFDDYLQQKDLIIKLVQYVNGLVGDAVTLNNDFESIDSVTIGDLEDLHTTAKDSVVDAINEVEDDVEDLKTLLISSGYNADLWEQGTIMASSGVNDTSNSRIRTKNYLADNIVGLNTDETSDYVFYLFAWNSAGTYVGIWNGTTYTTTFDADTMLIHTIDISMLRSLHPGYQFKVVGRKLSGNYIPITPSESTNYIFSYIKVVLLTDYIRNNERIYNDVKYKKNYNCGLTWDWWIRSNAHDKWGNEYIGFIGEDGYVGIMKKNTDGSSEYTKLGASQNNDDHNAIAVLLLDDGRILCIGAGGHGHNNKVLVYRSVNPYSIEKFDDFSYSISDRNGYSYELTYSQPFLYNGTIYNFMRGHATINNTSDSTGYLCLKSTDNGETWSEYVAFYNLDPYITFSDVEVESGLLRYIAGNNPTTIGDTYFKGGFVNLATEKITNLADAEIGSFSQLTGSFNVQTAAKFSQMTSLTKQTNNGKLGRLFTCAKTPKSSTVFLMAHSDDENAFDFTYQLYANGSIIALGKSGIPFGNKHYVNGACFGYGNYTKSDIYYIKTIPENIGQPLTFTSGGYINCRDSTADINSPTANPNYRYSVTPCTSGDIFTVNAKGASLGRAWAFIQSDGTVIQRADDSVTVTNLILKAPANSAYLIVNDNNTGTNSYVGAPYADGSHEIHKVTINNGTIETDVVIYTASMSLIRPLYCGCGKLLVSCGHYNDQNLDGTYDQSFLNWNLSPLFVS